jgi:hypothetical protein
MGRRPPAFKFRRRRAVSADGAQCTPQGTQPRWSQWAEPRRRHGHDRQQILPSGSAELEVDELSLIRREERKAAAAPCAPLSPPASQRNIRTFDGARPLAAAKLSRLLRNADGALLLLIFVRRAEPSPLGRPGRLASSQLAPGERAGGREPHRGRPRVGLGARGGAAAARPRSLWLNLLQSSPRLTMARRGRPCSGSPRE